MMGHCHEDRSNWSEGNGSSRSSGSRSGTQQGIRLPGMQSTEECNRQPRAILNSKSVGPLSPDRRLNSVPATSKPYRRAVLFFRTYPRICPTPYAPMRPATEELMNREGTIYEPANPIPSDAKPEAYERGERFHTKARRSRTRQCFAAENCL